MRSGFTLLEIIIVVGIIGILMSVGLPRLFRLQVPANQQFVARLNAFMQQGAQAALQTARVQTIRFNLASKLVERDDSQVKVSIPDELKIQDIIINGEPQVNDRTTEVRVFITPQGRTQNVKLLLTEQERNFTYILNPFTVQFVAPV